jgi:hypothetical protein
VTKLRIKERGWKTIATMAKIIGRSYGMVSSCEKIAWRANKFCTDALEICEEDPFSKECAELAELCESSVDEYESDCKLGGSEIVSEIVYNSLKLLP